MTVPVVLSPDHATILSLAQNTGGMVNVSILARELGWDKKRSMLALNVLLREGMTWIDEQVRLPVLCHLCVWFHIVIAHVVLDCSRSLRRPTTSRPTSSPASRCPARTRSFHNKCSYKRIVFIDSSLDT